MPDKPRVKGLIVRKLENPEYRKRHDEQYAAFKLEAQILQALERKGWTYAQLAEAANTYKSNISRDLRTDGLLKASFSRISKIAGALGMTLIALLIPKEQEAAVIPKIDALVRASFDRAEIQIVQQPIINTEAIVNKPVINAGAGSNYAVVQDQTVIYDESTGYMSPYISQ